VFNKNVAHLTDPQRKLLRRRCCAILMGDSIGDVRTMTTAQRIVTSYARSLAHSLAHSFTRLSLQARMSDGLTHFEAVMRVGFLPSASDPRLSAYRDAFDVVLCGDESLDFVLDELLGRMPTRGAHASEKHRARCGDAWIE